MSQTDEYRFMKKQLDILKKPFKGKGKERADCLAQLAKEEVHLHGAYQTELQCWTCSCLSYLISQFLLCKHLICAANKKLKNKPLTNLKFFLNLGQNHYPPFYLIPGIHTEDLVTTDNETEVAIKVLGRTNGTIEVHIATSSIGQRSSSPHIPDSVNGDQSGDEENRGEEGHGDDGHSMDVEQQTDLPCNAEVECVQHTATRFIHLQQCLETIRQVPMVPGGVHPKMSEALEAVLIPFKRMSADINKNKSHRSSQ
ncbi:hypothetical protein PILCRDRAFT_4225 [Piloderma croceum F 1598]|uniref:SWIM-type domain-containing protein n=1 Tax=Piloderma croceum (strain F 1598) TaxID=765440 RepID=A0A0C3G8K5_PILCF|nr:hypothetical protein PILCRDRAFT_4225 [Piloderma croceum F 1598]